ncbi:MAG: glutamine--fructose-6-phosphate transaminase [Deferribacteraceae bacterium]|jgi:glucosamine--fructose-6-phosphate aminotransferase (isomerizing)|nr:glutamine--fructose-6-phosphate transaminase [Deferribacteraceae bacterium]
MCGIVAYIGSKNATDILIEGLTRLEYRGYDSAGIAVIINNKIEVFRSVGKLLNLKNIISEKKPVSNIGIGHTRWATHGKPSYENAHPHSSFGISLVHNGIIENYLDIKRNLADKGYKFESETDTEVIAHLIHSNYKDDIFEAVKVSVKQIKGSFALAVISVNEPDKIILARHDSPLVIGISDGENFAASDIPALISYTNKFIFLEENDIAVLTKDSVTCFDFEGKKTDREIKIVDINPVMAEKAGYRHFMQKEIYEQPRAIIDTIRGKYSLEEGMVLLPELQNISIENFKRFNIVACGTSWHAGLIGKFYIEKYAKIPVEVDIASEYRYRDNIIDKNTLFIAISQSGETADTIAALRIAKKKGASILSICNVIGSTITRESDATFYTHAGPEIGVASTKAFTTQVVALFMLAIYFGQRKGDLSCEKVKEMLSELLKLPELIEHVLKLDEKIENIARNFKDFSSFLYLGRNVNYPVALEGALKLKEISYIHAEGYPAGEMKHGPIALIDKNMPVFVIATDSKVYDKVLANIQEVKARDGIVIATVTEGNNEVEKFTEFCIKLPEISEELSVFLNSIVVQLLAYHIAAELGLDVDQPRNLAKSVTVE